ncbi:hypothetical protein ISN45_Aa03g023500 [Arabidopsis thaliana x Arabidopsis arenosa]|uniref:Transmembrane protein n=1 Tax=Arabidopsis thaliana x Arabidopsis arenosa TaxID=1240361 RepID=A0A8T2B242_9BRAS|nr:hypothetical protein ISN45_Aa03g023500 [Arabidopsis thaliana x Arabidopsis arenosa]
MKTGSARSNIPLYVFVLALVLSPTLPCQADGMPLGGGVRKLMASSPPILICPECECCAPAPPGSCCPCHCPDGP